MREDVEILKEHVESLGLQNNTAVTVENKHALWESLYDSDELALANHVKELTLEALEDLIVNLY